MLKTRILELTIRTFFIFQTATDLDKELMEKSKIENYPINAFSSFAYDAVWSIALTLHQSSLIFEARNKRLSNLTYGDSETAGLFRNVLRNLTFLGMSVSMLSFRILFVQLSVMIFNSKNLPKTYLTLTFFLLIEVTVE